VTTPHTPAKPTTVTNDPHTPVMCTMLWSLTITHQLDLPCCDHSSHSSKVYHRDHWPSHTSEVYHAWLAAWCSG